MITYFDEIIPPLDLAHAVLNKASERGVGDEREAVVGVLEIDHDPGGQVAEHAHDHEQQRPQHVLLFQVSRVRFSRLKLSSNPRKQQQQQQQKLHLLHNIFCIQLINLQKLLGYFI